MKRLKMVFNGVLVIYIGILLMIMLPALCGLQVFAVTSGSMQPEIAAGSVVYVKQYPFEELQKGDIVTYWMNGTAVTHRIIEKDSVKRHVQTKGDANETADAGKTDWEQIAGKVCFSLPYLGYIAVLFQEPQKKAGLLVLLFCLFGLQTLLGQASKHEGEEMDMI